MKNFLIGFLILSLTASGIPAAFANENDLNTPESRLLEKVAALQAIQNLNEDERNAGMIQIAHEYQQEARPEDAENNLAHAAARMGLDGFDPEAEVHEMFDGWNRFFSAQSVSDTPPFDVWGCLGRAGITGLVLAPAAALVIWGTAKAYETAYGPAFPDPTGQARPAAQYIQVPFMTVMSLMTAIIVPSAMVGACMGDFSS